MSAVTIAPVPLTRGADGEEAGAVRSDRLWSTPDRERFDVRGGMLPEVLRRYDQQLAVPLRHDRSTVIANFVATIDGIVAFGHDDESGGGRVSGFHEPDRFVMGLLRALADAVVIGAGTFRAAGRDRWTPGHVAPAYARAYSEWRAALGVAQQEPTTIVVSAGGSLPADHPGLSDPTLPAVVVTTRAGAARLAAAHLAPHVRIEAVTTGTRVPAGALLELTAEMGARLLLCEGGPRLLASLVEDDLLDELFLTLAPQLAGRNEHEARPALVEGVALPALAARWQELVSVQRSGNHLFLRYRRVRPDAEVE